MRTFLTKTLPVAVIAALVTVLTLLSVPTIQHYEHLYAQGYSVGTNQVLVPMSACVGTSVANTTAQTNVGVSGATGLGIIPTGASNTPVYQLATTVTGTNTHTYTCRVNSLGKLPAIVSVEWDYGTIATLGTQAAVLASGTMNGQLLFSTITLPATGAAETPSTVTPVRWDAGTVVINPVVASFNVTALTAGAFYTATVTPATALTMATPLTDYFVSFALLNTATTATATYITGVKLNF
jgi:hypothetical protein